MSRAAIRDQILVVTSILIPEEIIGVKKITDSCVFAATDTIEIAEFPTPPFDEYEVNYWIVLGGFETQDILGNRKTAFEIEVRE